MAHIVTSYDAELNSLRKVIAEMGDIAHSMLSSAIAAVVSRDIELAQETIKKDKTLDGLQRTVEERAVLMIARRQPMAIDLRETIATIRIAGDLERIGDLAKNLCKRTIAIREHQVIEPVIMNLKTMSDLALGQLHDVLDAYAKRDLDLALDVWKRDSAVDALDTSLSRDLLMYMMEDQRSITFCMHMMFCSKNVERIGDHTTNIAETIYYLETGDILTDDRPKDDALSYMSTKE